MNAVARTRDPDTDAFAYTLSLIDWSFRLARPEARDFAHRILSQYTLTVLGLYKRGARFEEKAKYYQDRADEVQAVIERWKGRTLYRQDRSILAEQKAQPQRRDPILALVGMGYLGHEHQSAAQAIAECFEGICRALMPKVRDMALFVPPPKNGRRKAFDAMPDDLWEIYTDYYIPWTREMHRLRNARPEVIDENEEGEPVYGPPRDQDLSLVLDIVVDGLSVDAARRRMRPMPSWQDCFGYLERGLDLWGDMQP